MIEDVKLLISGTTGYEVPETDCALLSYLWTSTGQYILNMTAQEDFPAELDNLQTRMTAAAYISTHVSQIAEACDMSAVKMIKEGEVSVDLSNSSPETILQGIAAELKGNPEEEMACFRKLRW
jgi:hypothetical protein